MVWSRRVGSCDNEAVKCQRNTNDHIKVDAGRRRKQFSGVSPVISTTILLGISVTLGLALWSMVTSNTNTAGEAFTNEVTEYVNYVNERYVIVNMAFEYDEPKADACLASNGVTNSNCVTIWILNFSEKDVRVTDVLFGTSALQEQVSFKVGSSPDNILKANSLANMTLVYAPLVSGVIDKDPFKQDGSIFYAKVITEGGASRVYYQADAKPEEG